MEHDGDPMFPRLDVGGNGHGHLSLAVHGVDGRIGREKTGGGEHVHIGHAARVGGGEVERDSPALRRLVDGNQILVGDCVGKVAGLGREAPVKHDGRGRLDLGTLTHVAVRVHVDADYGWVIERAVNEVVYCVRVQIVDQGIGVGAACIQGFESNHLSVGTAVDALVVDRHGRTVLACGREADGELLVRVEAAHCQGEGVDVTSRMDEVEGTTCP